MVPVLYNSLVPLLRGSLNAPDGQLQNSAPEGNCPRNAVAHGLQHRRDFKWRCNQEMYAIIATGGKQYKVEEGDFVFVEKIEGEVDEVVTLDKVLALSAGDEVKFGTPYVEGATVEAKIVKQGKGEKIRIIKHKAKKGYRKRQGHRQPFTQLSVEKINA